MPIGRIIDWKTERGFGFIRRERERGPYDFEADDEPDVFFHVSQFDGDGRVGCRVSFDLVTATDGRSRATGIALADGAAGAAHGAGKRGEEAQAVTGTLVAWFDDRGFGFLRRDDGGGSVFLGASECQRAGIEARVGDELRFDIERDRQGRLRATNPSRAAAAC